VAGVQSSGMISVRQKRTDEDVFMAKRQEVLALWPTGKEVDLEEAVAYQMALPDDRRRAVLLRFVDEMSAANRDLTFAGVIVVAPGVFLRAEDHEADELITNEQKTALDALHLRKIDLADRVLVVNPGGYIGESTSREIAYAHATGKPISFTDPV